MVAAEPDLEEATWLAFLIAYLGPLDGDDPFAAIEAARTPWAQGAAPALDGVALGPRGAHDPQRGSATSTPTAASPSASAASSRRSPATRAGAPQQRFERIHERLALPGLHGRARYDLLVTLGRLGRYPLAAPACW